MSARPAALREGATPWQDVPGSETTNTVSLPATDPAAFFRLAKGPIQIPPPPGMIGWWSGDGDARDLTGSNHGTLMNGASFGQGTVGEAFSFDGVDDYVKVPDNDLWAFGTGNFTIDFWANFASTRFYDFAHPEFTFLDHDEGPGAYRKWAFALGGGVLFFHINDPDNGELLWIGQTPFAYVLHYPAARR